MEQFVKETQTDTDEKKRKEIEALLQKQRALERQNNKKCEYYKTEMKYVSGVMSVCVPHAPHRDGSGGMYVYVCVYVCACVCVCVFICVCECEYLCVWLD